MLLVPTDIYEKLEFNKVKELLKQQCLGDLGIQKVEKIQLHLQSFIIERLLREVEEYKLGLEQNHPFPISAYKAIDNELRMLDIAGYVLPIEGLQKINVLLLQTAAIFKFFTKTDYKERYVTLYDIVRKIHFDADLQKEIVRVIDENGDIRSDASSDLMKIRKKMISKRKEMDRKFREIIILYQGKGWLKDNIESFRNNRRVLAVPAEHKRKIRGIIHDESATGKTAFIEPEAIIEINNDLFDLDAEEKREIYRILRALSETLRPYRDTMEQYQGFITRFDVIQAKAQVAIKMKAVMPQIKAHPHIHIKNGLHPLLLLKNQREGKKTIPFDLIFKNNNRILVLSGPNAGGKSIAMKSVGLLQVMVQAGLLVPVDPSSEFGVFKQIFADIGDQQSIEDDLSTYSSRLKNARQFLQYANKNTLALIDEFGSGTDPKIGGSIAEAILNELNDKKIFGVITTHYSNLKVFAFKTKFIINGSMTFNQSNLSPTYELKVGRPGSSYAFEIAEKSGLPKRILKYAKHKTGKNEKAVDQLLIDLQREKKEVEDNLQSLQARQKDLDKLIRNYDMMNKNLEYSRKKLKLEVKQQALQETAQGNKELERIIREIRQEQNLVKAKELIKTTKVEKQKLNEEVTSLIEDIYYRPEVQTKKQLKKGELKTGDFVRLKTGGSTGQIESIKRNTAVVVMGLMRMNVKLRDLQHADEPLEIQEKKGVQADVLSKSANFESKLDIRGVRREEALQLLEVFLDAALISSASLLKIIHGKGNGILRVAVRQKLREYKEIAAVRYEPENKGGDGVTVVEF